MFSGSTMLFDGVGGYVLVAVISFIAAVIITVICIRLQKKHREKMNPERDNEREETDHEK